MNTRIFLAGLFGGIAMFIWSSIAHMALPLGEAGIKEIPNESSVLEAMRSNIGKKPGLYFFPGTGAGPNASRQQKKEAMKQVVEKAANGPSGLLIYHPTRPFAFGRWLGIEFATELIEVLLAVFLLAQTRLTSFGARVGFVTLVGIIAAIATNVPYWNWYGFPRIYTASYMTTQVIGFLCAGLIAAFVLRNTRFGASA
jgi:hypothetical protein